AFAIFSAEPEKPLQTALVEQPVQTKAAPKRDAKTPDQPPVVDAKPASQAKPVAKKPSPPVAGKKPAVRVEAVEVEGDTLFVAGAAKRGALVRVYINNEPLGSARGTVDNRFLIARTFDLKSGKHSVRADVVSPKSGAVLSRAQVPLVHDAPAKSPTPKTGNTATQESVAKEIAAKDPKPTAPAVAATPKTDTVAKTVQTAKTETAPKAAPIADAPAPLQTGTSIIIKPGDNLWRISRRTYGKGIRYTTIYNANRDQIRDPSRIYIGQIFKIPQIAQSRTAGSKTDQTDVN
ncbi:MAG: LysM peptidoglycan-binding domain-containing protein, partial [Pseudomonadota bacterium]